MPQVKRYYVRGHGEFPVDMLRWDQAWPTNSESVMSILDNEWRTVAISSHSEPTIDRWKSFGWSVSFINVW